jgi:hypothetical protein
MNMTDWYAESIELGTCNCSFGCPCQFEGRATEKLTFHGSGIRV